MPTRLFNVASGGFGYAAKAPIAPAPPEGNGGWRAGAVADQPSREWMPDSRPSRLVSCPSVTEAPWDQLDAPCSGPCAGGREAGRLIRSWSPRTQWQLRPTSPQRVGPRASLQAGVVIEP